MRHVFGFSTHSGDLNGILKSTVLMFRLIGNGFLNSLRAIGRTIKRSGGEPTEMENRIDAAIEDKLADVGSYIHLLRTSQISNVKDCDWKCMRKKPLRANTHLLELMETHCTLWLHSACAQLLNFRVHRYYNPSPGRCTENWAENILHK